MNIRTPDDILKFMDDIKYGWVDNNNGIHYDMDGFRLNYRTMSIEKTLKYHVGTCIEQSILIKSLLDSLKIKNEAYCTRIYEGENFNDINAKERMHCFVLFYMNGKTFQLEHPDPERKGIHEFASKKAALDFLVKHYEDMTLNEYKQKGIIIKRQNVRRTTTKYDYVPKGLTYKEFNLYINNLNENDVKRR